MTPTEQRQAEEDSRREAKILGLTLLLLFTEHHSVRTINGQRFEYDASTAKFRVDGRAVSVSTIRRYLATIENRMAKRLLQITTQLENNEISFAVWQREFERSIKTTHILAGALILGSIARAASHRYIQTQIQLQVNFASNFATSLVPAGNFASLAAASGTSVIPSIRFSGSSTPKRTVEIPKVRFKGSSFARIKSRAKSYSRAAHITFSNLELQVRIAIGVDTQARRRLRAAEHCRSTTQTPGCLELALKDWIAIEDMIPIGLATCKNWCKCFIEYR